MELFEKIRREYEQGETSIRGLSTSHQVHRRIIRQAIESAIPPERKTPVRACPKLSLVKDFIEGILIGDKKVPRKQRHTAHRIWTRIGEEHPAVEISESVVRTYVRKRKWELGLKGHEVCIHQVYQPGQEAQIDWYEAMVLLGGVETKVYFFCMRSMFSGGGFHRAYARMNQGSFLEAHEKAFEYFGGVFATLRYDNLKTAVKKILQGHRREETTRFIAFRSHWRFSAEFCNVAEAHEKGGVEGEGGYFRRNHLVPIPAVATLSDLNQFLEDACRKDENRVIGTRTQSVGSLLPLDRERLLPMPMERFDLSERVDPLVDGFGCVPVKTNRYSTPLRPGAKPDVRIGPALIEIWFQGRKVAEHERSFGRQEHRLNLEHYLDVLEQKPGAFPGSLTLAQCRKEGKWPESYDQFWNTLQDRHGASQGTKLMIEFLRLGVKVGQARLRQALEEALATGCKDVAAIQHFLNGSPSGMEAIPLNNLGELSRYDRPLPTMHQYDGLINQEVH